MKLVSGQECSRITVRSKEMGVKSPKESWPKVAIIALDWAMTTKAGERIAHGIFAESFSDVALQDLTLLREEIT
jgi:hypothetical protein